MACSTTAYLRPPTPDSNLPPAERVLPHQLPSLAPIPAPSSFSNWPVSQQHPDATLLRLNLSLNPLNTALATRAFGPLIPGLHPDPATVQTADQSPMSESSSDSDSDAGSQETILAPLIMQLYYQHTVTNQLLQSIDQKFTTLIDCQRNQQRDLPQSQTDHNDISMQTDPVLQAEAVVQTDSVSQTEPVVQTEAVVQTGSVYSPVTPVNSPIQDVTTDCADEEADPESVLKEQPDEPENTMHKPKRRYRRRRKRACRDSMIQLRKKGGRWKIF